MNLVYKNEKPLFAILLVISLLMWTGLIVGTFGSALLVLLSFYIAYLFAQSAFISYLKGTGVKITASQFRDLHDRIEDCCDKFSLKVVPDAYILQADGAFNAFATKFLGRNFIILFSDVVDAFDDHPDALNFYIGHEIGHIKRNHMGWAAVIFPASFLPLIGAAYSRAREYTCDRYGFVACNDVTSAQFGMAALAAGGKRWRTMSKTEYVFQVRDTAGFWMSFHEYLSDYPWLVKRMAALKSMATGERVLHPPRNPFAGLLALFVPRLGVAGAAGPMLMVVAVIGVLSAIAVPAYQDYVVKSKMLMVTMSAKQATQAVEQYYYANKTIPENLEQAGFVSNAHSDLVQSMDFNSKNSFVRVMIAIPQYAGKSLVFIPSIDADKKITWRCVSEDIPNKVLPPECHSNQAAKSAI